MTFSVGVLQNDDVVFEPALPDWKQEAIQSIVMVSQTSVVLYASVDEVGLGDLYEDFLPVSRCFLV